MSGTALVVIGVVVLVVLVVIALAVYNGLVKARLKVREAWGAIQVQLQRRASLIPNLVETVKGYAEHERGTLDSVKAFYSAAFGWDLHGLWTDLFGLRGGARRRLPYRGAGRLAQAPAGPLFR